jgi:ABC-2 type transport system ATP-binding protein
MPESSLLKVQNLNFAYKANDAVLQSLSFELSLKNKESKLIAILGPNGSGKSTLFKILSTQLTRWSGEVSLLDCDVSKEAQKVRSLIGVCFQSPSLDSLLTGWENLKLQAQIMSLSKEEFVKDIEVLARNLKVDYLSKRVGELSGGQARRLEIIKALLGNPKVLFLDEPTSALDLGSRRDFWKQLRLLAGERGVSVLVSTHYIEEAELCDELIIMSQGKCVAQGSPKELRAALGYDVLSVDMSPEAKISKEQIAQHLLKEEKIEILGESFRIATQRVEKLFEALRVQWPKEIQRMEWAKPTLADVYFENTGKPMSHEL